jgi:hypothetical protein
LGASLAAGAATAGLWLRTDEEVVGAIKGAEIWLSDKAKGEIDQLRADHAKRSRWELHENVEMKGFGKFTLWSVK